jgi:hypothetical protein
MVGQRLPEVVDSEDGARQIMPMLLPSPRYRQHMIEGKLELALPEIEQWLQIVGKEADIHSWFSEVHGPALLDWIVDAAGARLRSARPTGA